MTPEPSPPRVAEALLSVALPGGGVRESVLGDLHQLYLRRRARDGAAAARAWYWAQVVRLGLGYGFRRVRGIRYVAFTAVTQPRPSGGDGAFGIVRSVRFALRSLRRNLGFSVPAFLILTIGMTAATSIFAVVDAIVFEPLDLPDSHRLVVVCEDHLRVSDYCIASPGNAEDFRLATTTIAELGFGRGWPFHLEDGATSEGVRGGLATAGFLRALRVTPALGRIFTDEEIGPGRDGVALLSHALWSTHWGRDPSVIGTTVELDGQPVEIVGVLPAGFEVPLGLAGIDVWKPPHIDPLDPEVRGWRGFRVVGRLAEGSNVAAADAELSSVYDGLRTQHAEIDESWGLRVEPLLREVVGDTRPVLLAFLGGAALLLLIVTANVANLVLARGLQARRELAVRAALGAGRGQLVSQMLVESLTLSALATGAALALGHTATKVLVSLAPPEIPRLDEVALDLRVLVVAALVGFGLSVAFAIVPALRVTRWNLASTIKSGGRAGRERGSDRLRGGLVMVEIALSTMLLASAILLTRSFQAYLDWNPGFERERLLSVSAFVSTSKYPSRAEFMGVIRRGEEAIEALPGVVDAASASAGPLFGGGDGATGYLVEGMSRTEDFPSVWWYDVGPGFFQTLGVPMVAGREFTEADGPDVGLVAIVNETMARQAWPGLDPVGQVVRLPEIRYTDEGMSLTVVGVVADVPPLTPGDRTRPEIYWANRQLGRPAPMILVKARGDPAALSEQVTQALLEVDPDISLGTPRTLSSAEARALVRPRFEALVLLSLALVALALAAVGVYAVVSYSVATRVREMGIRMAIGADAGQVIAGVMKGSVRVALAGAGAGLVGSVWLGRFLGGVVHGVSPTDPTSLGAAAAILMLAGIAASFFPARRATRVDPLVAVSAE